MEFVGKFVKKEIKGYGFCSGFVRSYNSSGIFKIIYENGVKEYTDLAEVVALVGERNEVNASRDIDLNIDASDGFDVGLRGNVDLNCSPVKGLGSTWGCGVDLNKTVPEITNGVDMITGLDCDLNQGLDLVDGNINHQENSSEKTRGCFDLNVVADCDLDDDGVCALKKGRGFDLNLEVNDEDSDDGVFTQTNGHDIVQVQETNGVQGNLETGESKDVHVAQVSSAQLSEELGKQNSVSPQDLNTPDSNVVELDHDLLKHDANSVDEPLADRGISDEHTSGRKRKRKGSEISKVGSHNQLRRSSRRKLAQSSVSSTATACLVDEVSPCPSVSSLTGDGKAENLPVLPPKPELPPSSPDLYLDGLPILDVFSTYSWLRSFSTKLFLSPFELKDFVEALRCMSPSLLFDSIHVSILQRLRKHLKKLAADGNESATACLRNLDWDTLDVVTYPLFVVEYLLFFGFKDSSGMDLTRPKFRNEYFRQPMNLKVKILSRLCADMTKAEAVRPELEKRYEPESQMELVRKTNTDGSLDGNIDRCRLCKMGGTLLCCDGCPAAYHSKCIGIASRHLPEGDWYCLECTFEQDGPDLNLEKQIRGELIETDPYGRKYYNSLGYLLVIDTDGSGSYYNANDVILVLEQLKSCSHLDTGVINAIQKHWDIHSSTHNLARRNARKGIKPNVESETGYRNQYMFAQMTKAISKEIKSLDSATDMRFDVEIASTQVNTMLTKTSKFQWRYIQSLYLDAWKEKCGWCHACKSEGDGSETNCLFNMSLGALRGPSEKEVANSQSSTENIHLMPIICQILSMESRLQGLLVGPWLNPHHSRIWRERVLNASNISTLKHLLVQFEANLHHRVLSVEWLHHVDSKVMGSAIHFIASTRSKSAVGKKPGALLKSGEKNGGLTMCWSRGGELSRQLFNSKVLPRSLISNAARQGGSLKIPGILYPENSVRARRSRRVAWEADVESSTTSALLGFQVRTLHSYINWDDIENSHLLLASDKESKKSAMLFKKAIVRRKCIEEETVKYLLDFGKRRVFPDVVLKNGRKIEESSSGRKKFWLNESYLPLHIMKRFEEKKALRKTKKPRGSYRHSTEIDKVRKIPSQRKGFSYLFERAERAESSLLEQSKEDVSSSEAACCNICKKLFNKEHVKEGMYVCLQCRSEVEPIERKMGRPPGSKNKKFGARARISARLMRLKTSLAKVIASKTLRRSGRQPKQVIGTRLQDENEYIEASKKRKLEPKGGRSRLKKRKQGIPIRKKKTERYFSYWLNGLKLSRKPCDELVNKFRRDSCWNLDLNHDQPKCRLCGLNESESGSTIISCGICKEWYHGDAFGLNEKTSAMVIGFRCNLCREKPSPICPHM